MTPAPQATVLVIDNDEALVRAIALRLEQLGLCSLAARTGAQGLAKLAEHAVDLVVTDLNMPNLDGVDLITAIRRRSGLPIIVMTGFRRDYDSRLAGIGDVTILCKPFYHRLLTDLVLARLRMQRCVTASPSQAEGWGEGRAPDPSVAFTPHPTPSRKGAAVTDEHPSRPGAPATRRGPGKGALLS